VTESINFTGNYAVTDFDTTGTTGGHFDLFHI
jgi:hypothetical protein